MMMTKRSRAVSKMRRARSRADFAVENRVQFTNTEKKRHIYNGNVGTITRLNPSTGKIIAMLERPGRTGGRCDSPSPSSKASATATQG